MAEFVTMEVNHGVGVIRLDRPPVNAISWQVGKELSEAFREAADRPDVASLVIWGGPRMFGAGADIEEMARFGPADIEPVVSTLGDALDFLEAMPKISIAAIAGLALGGGFELALACDLRYAAAEARVGQPEILLGVIPGAGGTQRITRLAGPGIARDLTYSGRQVGAGEARSLGLVERVVVDGDVFEAALEDARAFARGSRSALAAAKAAIAAAGPPGRSGSSRERQLFVDLFGTPDQREGMQAFLDKREPRFGGGTP